MVGSKLVLVTSWVLILSLWVGLWILFFDREIITHVIGSTWVEGGMWEDGEKWGGRSWVRLGDVCKVSGLGIDYEVGRLRGIGIGCDNGDGCGFNTKVGGFWFWSGSEEVADGNWVKLGVMRVSDMVELGSAQKGNFFIGVEYVGG